MVVLTTNLPNTAGNKPGPPNPTHYRDAHRITCGVLVQLPRAVVRLDDRVHRALLDVHALVALSSLNSKTSKRAIKNGVKQTPNVQTITPPLFQETPPFIKDLFFM